MIFECVPNVSEGRDAATIAACAEAIAASGAHLANCSTDPDHHRTVFTYFGAQDAVVRAAGALAAVCAERIDLSAHAGVHPRIGALDVLPVVPMRAATLEQAAAVARACARELWTRAGLPSIFYGEASAPAGRLLADVRRGQFEGLAARAAAGELPDEGTRLFHPTAGLTAVGARGVLVAFNVVLRGGGVDAARRIAAALRESGGGLRTVRALGLRAGDAVQVSFNLTDPAAVPPHRVLALVQRMAEAEGASVERSELIGLLPRESVQEAVRSAFANHE